MRFSEEMMAIAHDLEIQGKFVMLQCGYGAAEVAYDEGELTRLANIHRQKIDLSDGIYVVNIDGYIGTSTQSEIAYAIKNGKVIYYHEPVI